MAAVVLILAMTFAYLLFSENGVIHVYQLKIEKEALQKRITTLEQTKKILEQELIRLGSNPETVEAIIRQQLGFIRDDETLFIFPQEKPTGP